jgi:hypothetical protein
VRRRRERERQAARRRTERKAAHTARRRGGGRTGAVPGAAIATYPSETRSGPVWSGTVVPPDWEGPVLTDQQWTPGQPPIGYAQPEYQQPEYARPEFAPTGYPQAGYLEAGYPQAACPEAEYPDGGYPEAGRPFGTYPDQTVAAPPSVDGATGADVDGRRLLPARRVR